MDRTPVGYALRVTALVLVTFIAFAGSWQLASEAAASRAATDVAQRAEPAARGGVYATRAVAEAPASTRPSVDGQMVVFSLGLPLTVADGALTIPLRVPRATTVQEALSLAGVSLGELDRVDVSERTDSLVASGDVIRVIRVTESDTVVRENVPYTVTTLQDATLDVGKTVIVTAGQPGVIENTYRVRLANGVEESRSVIVVVRLSEPVGEVRRVGTRPIATPKPVAVSSYGSGDIQSIIIAAAERFGVDSSWLLRVAKCESGFNPNAYNPSGASGLFQFMPATFAANSVRAGFGGASIWDPVASANTAAYMFSVGQSRQWVCK